MTQELKIPPVGESITEVQISEWLKSEGDVVQRDEAVAVIDSEKTTFELPSPSAGRITRIVHRAGDTVGIGEVIAHVEPEGGEAGKKQGAVETSPPASGKTRRESRPAAGASEAKPAEQKKPTSRELPGAARPDAVAETPTEPEEPPAGKRAEKPAPPPEPRPEDREINSEARPRASTAEATVPSAGTGAREEEVVPMTMLRRTVARRLVEARQTMAMLTTFAEVDMSSVQALRKEHQAAFEQRYHVKLGLMSFFVKAAIDALKRFPQLNAEIRGDDIVYHNSFDLGVAIATERGLVVPVLRHAETLSFAEVEIAIGDLARRAQAGRLLPEELTGGTFTITNGGVFGSLLSTPIINPPQTGILGMHAIQERPVAVDGQVVIKPMMYLALTYDHRLVDGREAVLFLRRVKEVVESVARMLIEI